MQTAADLVIGAFAYVEDPRDAEKILLILRRNNPYAGNWSLPGGKVDDGETFKDTAAREVMEETGLPVEIGKYMGKVTFPGDYDRSVLFEGHVYSARLTDGANTRYTRPGSDVDAVGWMKKSDILGPHVKVALPIRKFYEAVLANGYGAPVQLII
jgi:acetyl-CoA carboxylase carboxyl transferase subunit beta